MWAGTSMVDSAQFKYSLAADYTFRDVLGGDIWVRADYYYTDGLYSTWSAAAESNPAHPDYDPTGGFDVDSWSKINLQMSYERESWNATLMVRNLTDDRANTYTGSGAGGYAEYWGHTGFGDSNNLARPRSISLRFTKRW